ncbi:MAG: hypothetical protein ACWA5W_05095, partial [Phycisphaerales bacterium]
SRLLPAVHRVVKKGKPIVTAKAGSPHVKISMEMAASNSPPSTRVHVMVVHGATPENVSILSWLKNSMCQEMLNRL